MPQLRTWLASLAILFVCPVHADAHLVATLRNTTPVGVMKRILITLTITNTGDEPVHVLKAGLPDERSGELVHNVFEVTDPYGRPTPYVGRWERPRRLTLDDFRLIAPGEIYERQIDLTDVYDIGAGGPVTYRYVLPLTWAPGDRTGFLQGTQEQLASKPLPFLAPRYSRKSVWWPD